MAIKKSASENVIKILHTSPTRTGGYYCSCGQVLEYKGNVFCVSIDVQNGHSNYWVQIRTQNGDWAVVNPPSGISGLMRISYVDGENTKLDLMKKDMEVLKEYILDVY